MKEEKLNSEQKKAIHECVTHSFKYTNSNCSAGGVRVGKDSALKLPFISVRTLVDSANILADYDSNTPVRSKQITEAVKKLTDRADEATKEVVNEYRDALKTSYCSNLENIDPRLRQVLMPVSFGDKGDYLSLTPLACADLSRKFITSLRNHNKNRSEQDSGDKDRYLTVSELGFGGANKQNAGYLISIGGLLNQLYTKAPETDFDKSRLYQYFFKGVPVFIDKNSLEQFSKFLAEHELNENREVREKQRLILLKMLVPVFEKASEVATILYDYQDQLPVEKENEGALISHKVSDLNAGLIFKEKRHKDWIYDFSIVIARYINQKLEDMGQPSVSNLSNAIEKVVNEKAVRSL